MPTHAFVRSRSRGYLGEIPRPAIEREGEVLRVSGNWKGTPPKILDELDDLLVYLVAEGPPEAGDLLLLEGRVARGSGRLSKIIEGRAAKRAPDAPLGFSTAS